MKYTKSEINALIVEMQGELSNQEIYDELLSRGYVKEAEEFIQEVRDANEVV